MQTHHFDIQKPDFLSFFETPNISPGRLPSSNQEVRQLVGGMETPIKGSPDVARSNYSLNDYIVGKTDARHATMVYEFLRLFCREEPSTFAADAVLIVDIQGRIYGYGCRHDSSFADVFVRWSGCLITEMLSEPMKRRWLDRNIESIALQRRHWRLFRLHDSGATHMVLMEFHPVEMQRTALVLWVLEG